MEAYLDNAATTRCSLRAAEAVRKALTEDFGNPSSLHRKGMEAEELVKKARETVAGTLHGKEKEILFTSGGTESNNLAIFGGVRANRRNGNRILTTAIEHPSVRNPMKELKDQGFDVIFLPVDGEGRLFLDALEEAADEKTILLSLMHVNNEIGTIQPVEEAAAIVKRKNPDALVHVDAIQSYGKLPLSPGKSGIDLLSVSGHKIHGPKGSGFLYVQEKTKLAPILFGGGQQRGYRSGTENVPGIAGLMCAAEDACRELTGAAPEIRRLRGLLIEELSEIDDIRINGGSTEETASPYIVSVSVHGVRSEVLLHALEGEGVYVSAGSACSSNKPAVSETLKAIGLPRELLDSTIRFSFSAGTTEEEVRYAADVMKRVVPQLRRFIRR